MAEQSASNSEPSDAPLQSPKEVNVDVGKESKQLELTRVSTKRRLQRYLSAHDAAKPIDIEFVDMRARVLSHPGSKETKEILHGVSGYIESGEFLALMGPSGAGKSSLLNVLGSRHEGTYTGQVYVNGKPRSKELKRKIGYVLQDDIILPNLTVKETLDITAKLRLPRAMTKKEKMERVDDVIHVMGLTTCTNTLVQHVSGGERKRLAIANELLINPSVLFLDEPTSGLDSTTAFSILTTLKELALQGRTIICVIHQPSSQMFAKFDKLLLLANGSVVYFGEIKTATDYFNKCGYPCPMHYNPADFLLELVSSSFESKDQNLQQKEEIRNDLIAKWTENSKNMENKKQSLNALNENESKENNKNSDKSDKKNKSSKWQTTWIEQFSILLYRAFKHRKGHILSFRTAFEICAICLIAGALWFQADTDESNLTSWVGAAFFIQIYLSFTIMFRGVVHFPTEKVVIKRERQSGAYRLSSYYVSKLIAETPIDIILPLVAMTIYYWMIGFGNDFGIYCLYLLVSCLGIVSGNAFGTFLGCALANFERALTSLAVIGIFFMLISGFYVKDRIMPVYISWLQVTSQMRYTYILSLLVLLKINKFKCAENDTQFEICETSNSDYNGYIDNEALLDFWGMDETIATCIIVLLCQTVFWHICAYWSLRRSTV